MKEITTEELKAIQLEIAKQIDEFCSANGIRYFLNYGTLIGAIRHKGFIPWDDDIDIGMPREDFERFVRSFNGAYPGTQLMSPELDPRFCMPFAYVYREDTLLIEEKITYHRFPIGVKVDVFPIDGAPSDEAEYLAKRKALKKCKSYLFYKNVLLKPRWKNNKVLWFKTIVWKLVLLPFSIPAIQRRIRKMATADALDTSEWADNLSFPNRRDSRVPSSVFKNYTDVEFEGRTFKTLSDYDTYLKAVYGDYMTPPPPEQCVPEHGFHAYWR